MAMIPLYAAARVPGLVRKPTRGQEVTFIQPNRQFFFPPGSEWRYGKPRAAPFINNRQTFQANNFKKSNPAFK
jgi:hypothetical protein